MICKSTLCALLLVVLRSPLQIDCRSYNNGLIFYNLENHQIYLPPTISVSRGRGLAKFKYSTRGSIWSTFGKPCDCKGPLCGCCVGIKVKQYNFDQKMCANVSYGRPKDEVQLEVFLNDTATAKYGISARNPSPLCVPIMMGIPMSMCIQMSNIGVQGDNLNMCMDFLVRLASTEIFEMHFQCMKVGLQGASWVGPDGQPVIPANEGKLKDTSSKDSDEYYDENEAENEIFSREEGAEEEEVVSDLNKAEEEMDNNDITEKIRDIVKEKEEQTSTGSSESSEEKKVGGMVSSMQINKNVEEIVTNIMDSINQGHAIEEKDENEETPSKMKGNKGSLENNREIHKENVKVKPNLLQAKDSVTEEPVEDLFNDQNIEQETKKEQIEENNEMQESLVNGNAMNQQINDADKKEQNNEVEDSTDLLDNGLKDEFNIEELFEDSQEKEMQMESTQVQTQDTTEAPTDAQKGSEMVMTPIIVLEETTTENFLDVQDTTPPTEMLQSTHNSEYNKLLKIKQPGIETSSPSMTNKNITYLATQKTTLTSESSVNNTGNNSIKTTTAKAITATNKPTKLNTNSLEAAATFANKNEIVDDDRFEAKDEDEDENDDANSGADDDDDDDDDDNDSDYEDEESDETENVIKDKTMDFKATSSVKSDALQANNKIANYPKESSVLQEVANHSNSNESPQSAEDNNENTNDEFETEEGEEYDDEFEDYEDSTLTDTTSSHKEPNRHNNTCCESIITTPNTIKPFKLQNKTIETAHSHELQFVSTANNNMTIQAGDKNMFNTKSTNKISPASMDSTATATTAGLLAATKPASGSIMPLPLARQLHFISRHRQQQPPQQLKRQNRRQLQSHAK